MACSQYNIVGSPTISFQFTICGGSSTSAVANASGIVICAEDGTVVQTGGSGTITQVGACTANPLEFVVGFGGAPEDACQPIASAVVTGDNTNFCSCTTFTGAIFASATFTGTYYVSYLGNSVAVFVTSGNPVANVTGACTACPPTTTTTTTTTTTAAPTTTTTTTTAAPTTTTTTAAPTTTTTTTSTTTSAPLVPVVSTLTNPVITVSLPYGINTVGISYQQFLNSLGKYNYGVEFLYMYAGSYPEISQPVYFTHFNSNGNQIATYMPFNVDPYQSQPSIYYEADPEVVVLDGLSSVSLNIFPQSTIFLKLFTTIAYLGNELDDTQMNNFEEIEAREGLKFFDDFCNYIIDTPQE
jgi:hypothetical protein